MSAIERAEFLLSSPIPLTNLFVNRPCCVILFGFAIMFAITVVAGYFGWLLPNDPNERDYFVWDDKYVKEFDKSQLARRELMISGDQVAPI